MSDLREDIADALIYHRMKAGGECLCGYKYLMGENIMLHRADIVIGVLDKRPDVARPQPIDFTWTSLLATPAEDAFAKYQDQLNDLVRTLVKQTDDLIEGDLVSVLGSDAVDEMVAKGERREDIQIVHQRQSDGHSVYRGIAINNQLVVDHYPGLGEIHF